MEAVTQGRDVKGGGRGDNLEDKRQHRGNGNLNLWLTKFMKSIQQS